MIIVRGAHGEWGSRRRGAMQFAFWGFMPAIILVTVVGWVVTTWIRAKHGYPLDDGAGHPVYKGASPDAVAEQVRQALASRVVTITKRQPRRSTLLRYATAAFLSSS